ncbi:zinc ribbon domain-containing protein [Solibaculum mannosilyticum]|uniref:Zinc-ribbon domain-containing protein n=1 Tax=Solibaculum mannosilyticum TaxID=2780922 RepID=A0A7I8D095_9FIRM|nr:zinc ribbon domain-containing protein [Solibaculum mannosilyticum]MCO7137888.1 zinc ribbon domain-containing protein [[Clostridium] leptum]BCI60191.1 hypothetical protein C12CBH8_08300 [Solibaculum mannosilyticum]CZT57927.1 hypothetical protein BN3661_02232 [Eubacteriaceae bacterium CHKCI005]
MAIFEDAFIKVKSAVDVAGEKTGEWVEISKLKIAAARQSSEIADRFEALGKMVYNASKAGGVDHELIQKKVEEIDEMYEKLGEINERIYELRNVVQCPTCKAVSPKEAIFCSKCGTKLVGKEEKKEDPIQEEKSEEPSDWQPPVDPIDPTVSNPNDEDDMPQ